MTTAGAPDFDLTVEELRAVAQYVCEAAREVLDVFESEHPGDPRPRAAVESAQDFIGGAARSRLQRVTSMGAHRAAWEATSPTARLAAQAAGDAASAAYLHPIAKAHQVAHILRASANVATIEELRSGGDRGVGDRTVLLHARRAEPIVVAVLSRYPPPPPGRSRPAQLMASLDRMLRAGGQISSSTDEF